MSSFGALSRFRTGYWLGIRNFLLQERRDVSKRLGVLNAEIDKIGFVRVHYHREVDLSTGLVEVTENRVSFSVTSGSSLEKLVQAYISLGGNPFDISPFYIPDKTEIIPIKGREVLADNYPYGGVVAPRSAEYNDPVGTFHGYTGGFPRIKKYIGNRFGSREEPTAETDPTVALVSEARQWANQEIKEKIQELEHRIIKLMDLREQLEQERDDVLVQAFGGTLFSLPEFDSERYVDSLRLQNIIDLIDGIFFDRDADGLIKGFTVDEGRVAQYDSFYTDVDEEIYLSLCS
jgi:hypothetical protein